MGMEMSGSEVGSVSQDGDGGNRASWGMTTTPFAVLLQYNEIGLMSIHFADAMTGRAHRSPTELKIPLFWWRLSNAKSTLVSEAGMLPLFIFHLAALSCPSIYPIHSSSPAAGSLLLWPLLPMSSIVDKWTAQFAKLREKSRAAFSGGGSSPGAEPEQTSSAPRGFPVLSQALLIKSQPSPSLFSEAAPSMLVDCVSP